MSSHHYVTESQTMALIVAGSNVDLATLSQLLEWNPWVLVQHSQLERIQTMNVRIDVLLADETGTTTHLPYAFQVWKDSELTLQLKMAWDDGKLAGIAFMGPAEADVPEILAPYIDWNLPVVCYTVGKKHYFIKKGDVLKKWMASGSEFHVDGGLSYVAGEVERNGNSYVVRSGSIIELSSYQNVLLTENIWH